jgi:acid stress chaperone HdeB
MSKMTIFARCTIIASAFLVAGWSRPVTAQVILDMSLLTCKDYLEAAPERQELVAAWMSGYFNASRNQPTVDFKRFEANKKRVANYCKRRKEDNLMSAIRQAAY